jgi:SAM-dependent methyltransferase
MARRPDLTIHGVEFKKRPTCLIDCDTFDGARIPHDDSSFDVCLFVDVLHHAQDMRSLLAEARRVARRYILIKDHPCQGRLDLVRLKFMDWVGNRPHGVRLPYRYLSLSQWDQTFRELGLQKVHFENSVEMYAVPANILFPGRLHFLALLRKASPRGKLAMKKSMLA